MMQDLGDQTQTGLLIFAAMIVALLMIFRFTRQNALLRQKLRGPALMVFFVLSIYNILYITGLEFPDAIQPYFFAILYLIVAIFVIRLLTFLFFDLFLVRSKRYRAPRLMKEITTVILLGFVIVIIIQDTLKIQVTTLLATSALITVVLGLALQETLGNLFAGLALQLDQPYKQGDWIRVADIYGKVEEVTWRATKLKTLDNDYVIVPNGQIAKEVVKNHSFPEIPHSTRVTFGVNFHTSPNRVSKVVYEALSHVDNVLTDPAPDVRLHHFSEFTIVYEVKFFIRDFGLLEPTLSAVRKAFWYHLRRNQIEIPFPIRNVYIHDRHEAEETHEKTIKRLADTLAKVYVFASLADEERLMIADRLVEMRYAEGEMIIREGEQGETFYIIETGEVEVYLLSAHGNRKVLTTLHDGEFFGEIALLTGQKRTANVRAITDVRVYRLDKDTFKEVLENKPRILDEISNVLARRKDQLAVLMAQSSGSHEEDLSMDDQDAKNHILSRIRSYFGI
jgi:small-conductance mechanosensitive channel/CRP-like cAMP-binding protein